MGAQERTADGRNEVDPLVREEARHQRGAQRARGVEAAAGDGRDREEDQRAELTESIFDATRRMVDTNNYSGEIS